MPEAVRSLDPVVEACKILVPLGPSDCGRTTTMRMIAGLETVTEGDILMDGNRVNDRNAPDPVPLGRMPGDGRLRPGVLAALVESEGLARLQVASQTAERDAPVAPRAAATILADNEGDLAQDLRSLEARR